VPLGEIWDDRVGTRLAGQGVKIHRRTRVMWIETDENSQLSLVLPENDIRPFDAVILAVPWHQAEGLFMPETLQDLPPLTVAQKLQPGTIAAVHLWFDRPITPLPHAILVGKLSQWIFRTPSKTSSFPCSLPPSSFPRSSVGTQFRDVPASQESPKDLKSLDCAFYQVVISAAHRLAVMEKEALLDRVLAELAEAFPDFESAKLLNSRVVLQPQAVFSMQPGAERHRPPQKTPLDNLFLAGDWTDTGWPATMESAVRSGYLAAEALLDSLDRPQKILVPDIPRGFWARKIIGS
jgi:phytoene dehydrogenase-like protein